MSLYSHKQQVAIALCPKFTAMTSAIASTFIIRDVVQTWRKESSDRITTRHRIILGMSVCDVVSSLAWFFTSWPMPKELKYTIWNVGNFKTCTAQGFFTQFAMGTVVYNFCLALYYLLAIRYGWTNRKVAKRLEPFMHALAIGFVFVTNTVALKLQLYNPLGYHCWIAPYPYFCTQSYENKPRISNNCLRGDNARIYMWLFGYGVFCFVTLFLVVSMFLVWLKIHSIERRARRLVGQSGRLPRQFARQAILYVGALFASWSFGVVVHMYVEVTGNVGLNYGLRFVAVFLVPSQGLFNGIVYFSYKPNALSSSAPERQSWSMLFGGLKSSFTFRKSKTNFNVGAIDEEESGVDDAEDPATTSPTGSDEIDDELDDSERPRQLKEMTGVSVIDPATITSTS